LDNGTSIPELVAVIDESPNSVAIAAQITIGKMAD
jgi:hypothetical protein